MRQVINNLLYDTSNASVVYKEAESKKILWQNKNTGTFFFSYQDGHIEPITREDAKQYLGLIDVSVYIQMFGEPQEG
jgi:hypothetical protein